MLLSPRELLISSVHCAVDPIALKFETQLKSALRSLERLLKRFRKDLSDNTERSFSHFLYFYARHTLAQPALSQLAVCTPPLSVKYV